MAPFLLRCVSLEQSQFAMQFLFLNCFLSVKRKNTMPPRRSRPPRALPHRTGGASISTSGVKTSRTPTALAATTDVDSAEHKQLPTRRSSNQQTLKSGVSEFLLPILSVHLPVFCLCLPPAPFCPCPLPPPHPPKPSPSPTLSKTRE